MIDSGPLARQHYPHPCSILSDYTEQSFTCQRRSHIWKSDRGAQSGHRRPRWIEFDTSGHFSPHTKSRNLTNLGDAVTGCLERVVELTSWRKPLVHPRFIYDE